MPAVSKKQFRYMKYAAAAGKISQAVADEFTKHVSYSNLPEHIPVEKKRKAFKRISKYG
jgi:hypothetical protein